MTNGGVFDLDGHGVGRIELEYDDERLIVNGGVLADSFSGEMIIGGNSHLDMNLDAPWEADANSEIRFGCGSIGPSLDPSLIGGAAVTVGGLVNDAFGMFDAPVTFAETVNVTLGETGIAQTMQNAVVEGGTFVLEEGVNFFFSGDVDLRGGHFTIHSQLNSDGAVRLDGRTTWIGDVIVEGIATQIGSATVSGLSTIEACVFDMDGGGNTRWANNSSMVVNVESIDSTISNIFDGEIPVVGAS